MSRSVAGGKERSSNDLFVSRYACRITLFFLIAFIGAGAQTWSVSSPNAGLTVEAKQDVITTISPDKACYFRILLGNSAVIDWSPLGVTTSDQNFVSNLTFVRDSQATIDETYTLPSGKRSTYRNNCKELVLLFSNANNRQVAFYIRAYNEAAAVRAELRGTGSSQVTGEVTGFTLPSGSPYWSHLPSTSDEMTFDQYKINDFNVNAAIPILIKMTNAWALLTEASVYGDYTGIHYSSKTATKNVFQVAFPNGQGAISGTLPWKLPWRVAMVGSTLAPILESSVVENLNPPCELTDISWIKAGRCAWSWLTQETGDATQQKRYIDFANQMGWEYNTIDWNFNKAQVADVCQYGTQKNVGNELWYNFPDVTSQSQQSTVFPQCRTWGLKSLKIDFIYNNGGNAGSSYWQNIMKWFDMTAKNLADNKLQVTLHGCTSPRGQRRRWPHLLTWEGVYGYEWIGRGYAGARHNCMIPFTRNVIGPADVTPVLFTTGQITNGSGSQRNSTDAHELATSVIFESGLQHFADRPEGYNACVGKPFLQMVPVTWDDIHFIDGNPGESAILARRKGNDWYVAGIFAGTAKTVNVSLSFLKAGSYTVDLYKDSTGGTKYTMAKQTVTINPSTPLSVWIKENGGFCCRIPNSYNIVSTAPETGKTNAARKQGGMDRLSMYRLVKGAPSRGALWSAGRLVDMRGKTVSLQCTARLPQGVFVRVKAEK